MGVLWGGVIGGLVCVWGGVGVGGGGGRGGLPLSDKRCPTHIEHMLYAR